MANLLAGITRFLGLKRLGSPEECLSSSQSSVAVGVRAGNDMRELVATVRGTTSDVIREILQIHAELLLLSDFRPGKVTDELLGRLVAVCTQIHDPISTREILSNSSLRSVIPSIRAICSQAESYLEAHWAEHILKGYGPEEVFERLKEFPFYENYEQLARLELCAICAIDSEPQRVAFIGSGPLPLTSLCLLDLLNTGYMASQVLQCLQGRRKQHFGNPMVLNIDHDGDAIAVSMRLSMKLGEKGQGLKFACLEAESAHDLTEFDAVYLAALVGVSQAEKEDILVKVAATMRTGALMIIRTSWGLRTCLYPEVDMTSMRLSSVLEVCLVLHPYNDVVNSVILARVRPGLEMQTAEDGQVAEDQ